LRDFGETAALRTITRTGIKKLFNQGKIQIKGQIARSSSGLAKGITYIDILK
jgi:ribosomal 50S subunit-recycling heat shock protein